MKTIGEIIPSVPKIGHHMPVDQLHGFRKKYPDVLGAVLMACTGKQATLLAELWSDVYPVDACTLVAWRTLADGGHFLDLLDKTDGRACVYFTIALNGVVAGKELRHIDSA